MHLPSASKTKTIHKKYTQICTIHKYTQYTRKPQYTQIHNIHAYTIYTHTQYTQIHNIHNIGYTIYTNTQYTQIHNIHKYTKHKKDY